MFVGFYTRWLPSHSRLRTTSCAKVFAPCSVTAKVFASGAPNQSLLLIHSLALSHDTMIMKGMGCIFCIIDCILPNWTICKAILPLAQFFCLLLVVKLRGDRRCKNGCFLEITLRFFPENPFSMRKFAMKFFGLAMTPPCLPLLGHFSKILRPKYSALKPTKSAM